MSWWLRLLMPFSPFSAVIYFLPWPTSSGQLATVMVVLDILLIMKAT